MSRHSHEIHRDHESSGLGREHRTYGQARTGSGGSNTELGALIDQAAEGAPNFSVFFQRLEVRGVTPIPSVNVRGLNGISYEFRGSILRGSDVGRAYTAHGLQLRKGVNYSPEHDLPAINGALDRARSILPIRNAELLATTGRDTRTRVGRDALSADQRATLSEIGRFRTVGVRDLIAHQYGGNRGKFDQDVRVLREAGLVERKTVAHLKSGRTYDVVVLTAKGRRSARSAGRLAGNSQEFYAGLVKPTEIRHDIGIYRMYMQERAEIESAGGKVTRIVMDFEIKRRLMSELNRHGEDTRDPRRKSAIAARNDIQIVNGRFVIPDLRVEYEGRDGATERIDLELATGDYKPAQIAAKQAAGLKIYGPDSTAGGTPWEPDYAAGVISI
jgi:hypothetical protein